VAKPGTNRGWEVVQVRGETACAHLGFEFALALVRSGGALDSSIEREEKSNVE
jgi:hypothetical protein